MADVTIVEALESFSVDIDGVPFTVNRFDKFPSDDPVTRGRAHLFGEVTVRRSRQPARPAAAVETATAAPGERRTVGGPGRPRAGKG